MLLCQKYVSFFIPLASPQQHKHCCYRCNDSVPHQDALRVLRLMWEMRRQVRKGPENPDLRARPTSGLRDLAS